MKMFLGILIGTGLALAIGFCLDLAGVPSPWPFIFATGSGGIIAGKIGR